MSSCAATPQYGELLQEKQPRVIRCEEQNEEYTQWLEELCSREELSGQERDLADLLVLLIEDFEEKHYSLKPASAVEAIRELMDANGFKQRDMVDVFRTASIASEVLRGKRPLTLRHVSDLARKFGVSAEVFVQS